MVDKKNTFISRGEEGQREREASRMEPSKPEAIHHRELAEIGRNLREAEIAGNKHDISLYTAVRESALADLSVLAAPRLAIIDKQFRRGVRTSININSTRDDIARHTHSPENYGAASGVAHRYSSSELQGQLSDVQQQRRTLHQGILGDARMMTNVNATEKERTAAGTALSTKWQSLEAFAQQEGTVKAGMAIQRRQGVDLSSMYEHTAGILSRDRKDTLTKETMRGQHGSSAAITDDFKKKLDALGESFGHLTAVLHDSTATLDQKNATEKAHKAASDQFDQASIKKAAIDKAGDNRWGNAANAVNVVGNALQGGAGIYKQWAIGREMDTMQLQAGMMGVANSRFQDSRAAAGGDMAAVLRLQEKSWEKSIGIGRELSGKAVGAAAAEIGGGVLKALVETTKGATAGAAAGSATGNPYVALGGAVVGGLGGGMSAVEQTSAIAAQRESGATGAGAFLAAQGASMGLSVAQQAMNSAVMQTAMDYSKGTWLSTSGAGSNRQKIEKDIHDTGFQGELVDKYAMGQDEILSLTRRGLGGLGKQFKKSDLSAAGAYEMAGHGSGEQYMDLRAQIASSGGTQTDLATVLARAVASGMDSSKNIADMTNTMSHMAAASSAGGVSTFGGAATSVAGSIAALKAAGLSDPMAIGAAGQMGSTLNATSKQRDISISSMVQSARLHNLGLNAGTMLGEAAAKMDPSQIQTLKTALSDKAGTNETRQKAIENAGLYGWITGGNQQDAITKVNKLGVVNLQSAAMRLSQSYARPDNMSALLDDYIDPEKKAKMTPADQRQAEALWQQNRQAIVGNVDMLQSVAGSIAGDGASTIAKRSTSAPVKRKATQPGQGYTDEEYRALIIANESGGNPTIRPKDKTGKVQGSAFGKYQFIRETADGLGGAGTYDNMVALGGSKEGAALQDKLFDKLQAQNAVQLKQIRKEYPQAAKYQDSELKAALHFVGPGDTRKWLKTGVEPASASEGINPGLANYMQRYHKGPLENRGDNDSDMSDGFRAKRAGAKAKQKETEEGNRLNTERNSIDVIEKAALQVDPRNFESMVKASAGHLDESVKELAKVVDKLTLNLGKQVDNTRAPTPYERPTPKAGSTGSIFDWLKPDPAQKSLDSNKEQYTTPLSKGNFG